MEQNKTNWFSFLKSLEDITREGQSHFTGGEAFNEFVNLISLRFKQEFVKKYIKDLKKKGIDDEDIAFEIDDDFLIENLYDKYCKVYEECNDKKDEFERERKKKVKETKITKQKEKVNKLSKELTELEKETEIKSRELYSLLYDFDRIWEKTTDPKNPDHKIMKRRDKNLFKHCIMERMMYNDGMNDIVNFKEKHEKISNFSCDHRYDIVKLIIKIHKTFGSDKLSEMDYDAFGEGYEKYTADEVMKAKSWGQYFTRRDVIDIIIDEIKPQYNEKGADETCGTGGFLLGFLKYVKKNLKEQYDDDKISKAEYKDRIKEFSKNIYGHEIVWKVFKPLVLNLQCHGIVVADPDENKPHIKFDSCLSKENLQKGEEYDFMAGNPPFGLSIKWEDHFNDKLGKNKIKNSVALILQLYLYKLKKNGRLSLVIDRGILNNGTDGKKTWEKALREKMVLEGGLYKILLLPTGIFAHTNFATAVVFFKKGVKAKEVEFVEGYFKEEEKGKGVKNLFFKDGIKIDMKKIEKNGFSLKLDDYIEKPKENTKGFVKLGEVCNIQEGYAFKKEDFTKNGINVIKISDVNNYICKKDNENTIKEDKEKYKKYEINKNDILICLTGSAGPKIGIYEHDDKSYLNQRVGKFTDITMNLNFFKYFLTISNFVEQVYSCHFEKGETNAQPNFSSKKILDNVKIPSLSLLHQQEIVSLLDTLYQKYKIEDTVKYLSGANIFNLLINRQYKEFEELLWYQEQIPRMMGDLVQIPRMKNDYIRGLFNTVESVEYKLGDIVETQNLEISKIEHAKESGKYPFYNCSIVGHLWCDKHVYDDEVLLLNKTNGSGRAKIFYNKGKFNLSGGVIVFKAKDIKIMEYLYNYLSYNIYLIEQYFVGQDKKNLNISDLLKVNVKLPSFENQKKIIQEIEKIESEQTSYANYAKVLKEQIDNMNITIKNICNIKKEIKENIKNEVENESETESSGEKPKNIKKKKKVENGKLSQF
jgi:type I restriction-modification system DNA methylase subunit